MRYVALDDRCSLVIGVFHAGFQLLFFPAAATQVNGLSPSLLHNSLALAVVGLLRGDEVDARVIMLGVVAVEVPSEVGNDLAVIQKSPPVLRGALSGAEGRLRKGGRLVSLGGKTVAARSGLRGASRSAWFSSDGCGR